MEDTLVETKVVEKAKKYRIKKIITFTLITTTALSVGFIHYSYVSVLFENDRNFSYLSELEREMSFRTEMGFYYSYYKTIVQERPFIAGITKLMYDKLVEYPTEVNAFNRFNIHPEVIIGSLYRYFEPWLNTTSHRECHMVDRGQLPVVESCIGIGEPIFFYLNAIWICAGLTVAAVFLHAVALSESVLGGLLAVCQYFANHAECTRVMWAPNERENLAQPLLLLQAWLVAVQLGGRRGGAAVHLQVSIFFLNCLCLLFWQFTQFIFLTQLAIFFVMEQLRIIDIKELCVFLHSHFCGLHMAVLLLQGNDMLKSSLYASFFIVISVYCMFFSSLRIKVQNRLDLIVEAWLVVLRILIAVCLAFYLKKYISEFLQVEEDGHIWDILLSKLTDFKTFHTMLYTCSDVFDFLPWSSVANLSKTFLIPFTIMTIINVCCYWVKKSLNKCKELQMKETEEQTSAKEKDGEINEKKEIDEQPLAQERDDDTDDSGIENHSENGLRKRKQSTDLDLIDKELKCKLECSQKPCDTKDNVILFFMNLDIDASIFYSISQMVVYGIMAFLVMRLKLLFATQMCIVSSLIMNLNIYVLPKSLSKYLPMLIALSMLPMFYYMHQNVSHEMSHVGEFSDPAQEELLQWISDETSPRAAFAGSMPVLASVMLSTRRPIVAHPHYEHADARNRAYAVYSTYGRFTPRELYHRLNKLQAAYLIVEIPYCYGRSNRNCTFLGMWDAEAPGLAPQPPLCRALLESDLEHFYQAFRNDKYAVFRLHDLSVRYMPRSFDT